MEGSQHSELCSEQEGVDPFLDDIAASCPTESSNYYHLFFACGDIFPHSLRPCCIPGEYHFLSEWRGFSKFRKLKAEGASCCIKYHASIMLIFWRGFNCVGSLYHYFSGVSRRAYIFEMQALERERYLGSLARKQSRLVFLLPSLTSTEEHVNSTLPFVQRKQRKRGKECGVLANIRKHLSSLRLTEHWHSLPRQVVASPVLGGIRKLSGHGSGQVAVGGSACAGTGPDELPRCLRTSVIMGEDFGTGVLTLC